MMGFDASARGPLDGVRVLDLSRLVAGNMTTLVLADYGADVIKLERPGPGDDLRRWQTAGISTFWKVYGRNKRSLALDLKSDEGRALFERLLPSAQVLVENFVPGTLERWGLGPDHLLHLNPDLVILRISAWGQTGPYRDRPGFGTLVEAMSGWAHLNGDPDRPPVLPPLALADMVAGLYGVGAVLTALRAVEQGISRGQVLDLSLFEPIFSLISSEAMQHRLTGTVNSRTGNRSQYAAPRNVYACADGGHVAISGSMQSIAERIFHTIGRPELIEDARFVDNTARVRNVDALDAILGDFLRKHDTAAALALFTEAEVPIAPVLSMAELVDHPYTRGRGTLVDLPDDDLGTAPHHQIIPRFSATPGIFRRPAPDVDADRADILSELDED